jgi:hypothetical protein
MVETSRWILLLLPWVVACSKSSAPHDAGTEAAAPSASVVHEAGSPEAGAANQDEVTHYPDQHVDARETVRARWGAWARTEASVTGGKVVHEIRAGIEAQRLADHDGFDLVVFPDPGDPSRTLEGWVEQNALIAVPGDAGRR